jgi:hypothetical protein
MGIASESNTTNHDQGREVPKFGRLRRRATQRHSSKEFWSTSDGGTPFQDDSTALEGLRAERLPFRITVGTRLMGTYLDYKLAQGTPPESSRLLATQAQRIATPAARRELAENWLNLIVCAREPHEFLSPKIPLIRERVIDARTEIESLADALRAPVSTVRGVTMARSLIVDGAGPIFNRGCAVELASQLREVIAQLDPIPV